MQILFILLGLIGLSMFFVGGKWLIKSLNAKLITEFPLTESHREFQINKKGLYAICFIGGWYATHSGKFKIEITKKGDDNLVQLKENKLKTQIRRKMKRGIEFFIFDIQEQGIYQIELSNQEDLRIKRSNLLPFNFIGKPKNIESVNVLIKETIPKWKRLLGIIFMVFGINISFWGIILGVNPEIFQTLPVPQ